MDIDKILSNDFSNESNLKLLKDVIKNLQDYYNDNRPEFEWHTVFEDIDDIFKEEWESDWTISEDGTIELVHPTKKKIEGNQLTHQNWFEEFIVKDLEKGAEKTFYFAYIEALRRIGISKIEIDTNTKEWNFCK